MDLMSNKHTAAQTSVLCFVYKSWLFGCQGLVLFKIDDEEWTLDLRSGKGKVSKGGAGSDKPDLTLTISDDNFVKLVMGKMGPQQVDCCQACFYKVDAVV